MARIPTSSPPAPPILSVDQLRRRIERLQRCVSDLTDFDPQTVRSRSREPKVAELETVIEAALAAAFGQGTPAFNRYSDATRLDNGPWTMRTEDPFGRGTSIDWDAREAEEARKYIAEGKEQSIALLGGAIQELRDEIADRDETSSGTEVGSGNVSRSPASGRVFVVHGHDEGIRESVARFLEHIGLDPIVLHEQANRGGTVIEKVERHSDVAFAVVLLTPDDVGGKTSENLRSRARQNVLLELGYFVGKLTRSNVCALVKGDLEIPSDFGGVVFEQLDAGGAWRQVLARELEAAGFNVDWNKVMRR